MNYIHFFFQLLSINFSAKFGSSLTENFVSNYFSDTLARSLDIQSPKIGIFSYRNFRFIELKCARIVFSLQALKKIEV